MVSDDELRVRWPASLVSRIVAKNFVLVVGAGASRGCANRAGQAPPSWSELILLLIDNFAATDDRSQAVKLVEQERYLEAADFLRGRARAAAKEQDFVMKIAEVTDGPKKDMFQPIALHDNLLSLDPDVILTTNYDRILERASQNGYNLHHYESSSLAGDVRVGNPVLVKVHGSVDNPSKIILGRSDYTRLRREGSDVLEVLQALFLTKTALFVGYSFNDPDIHLLLENVLGARGAISAHYLLTSDDVAPHQRDIYQYCYGTSAITFSGNDFGEMHRMLQLLGEQVAASR